MDLNDDFVSIIAKSFEEFKVYNNSNFFCIFIHIFNVT